MDTPETTDRDEPIRWGTLLASYRNRLSLTQEEVAAAAGMKRSFYARCETNKTQLIRPSTFNRLQQVLGFPGYEMLAAMGFNTSVGSGDVDAALHARIMRLTIEQQHALASVARAIEQAGGSPAQSATWPPPEAHPRDHLKAVHSDARPIVPISRGSRHAGDSEPGGRLTGT